LNETQEAELEKENSGISFGQVLIWFYLVFVVGIMVVDFFSYMRLNKKKEEPSRSSSLLLDGSEEFVLTSEKI